MTKGYGSGGKTSGGGKSMPKPPVVKPPKMSGGKGK